MPGNDDEILLIELIEDGNHDEGGDVGFGVGRNRSGSSGRTGKIVAGVIGVLALGGAAMAVSRDDTPAVDAATTESATVPRVSTTIPTAATDRPTDETLATVATTEPATTVFDTGTGPLIASETPLGLYFTSASDPSDLFRLDLTTGLINEVPGGIDGRPLLVVPTAEGGQLIDESILGGDAYTAVAGPAGTVWAPSQSDNAIVNIDVLSGEVMRTVAPPLGSLFGSALIGATSDGRPVVLGPDAGAYAINPDDTFSRFGDGFILGVQPGGYWGTTCDTSAVCQSALHSDTGATVTLSTIDFAQQGLAVAFAPSGRFALTLSSRGFDVADFSAGTLSAVAVEGWTQDGYAWFGAPPRAFWFGPDDRYVAFAPSKGIIVLDTTTGEMRAVSVPLPTYPVQLLGIAP